MSRLAAKVERLHPAWLASAIGLCALGFRIWVTLAYRADTIGHLVKGVPVYDGAHWDAMSADFAAGAPFSGLGPTAFDALRPFRWIFMGAIYALTGPSVTVTQVVFTLLGVLSVAMTFELLRRLTVLPVALAGAAYRAFSLTDARYGLTTASEPLGNFLSTLFLLLFVVAAQTWDRRRNGFYWAGAGIALGLTMLTRPEVLPILITLPIALAIVRGPRPSRRTLAIAALALCGGVLVVTGPWLIRQRVKYDIWQISANTPEVLYAATSPRYRVWQPAVKALTIDRNVHDRVVFYSAGVRQNLHDHLGFYVGNVWAHTTRIAQQLLGRTPLLIALALLTAIALLSRPPLRVLLPAGVLAILVWLLPPSLLCVVWLAALGWALIRRAPMLLIGAFAGTPIIALGMTAMSGDGRLSYGLEWPAFTLAVWLIGIVVGLPSAAEIPDWGRAGRIVLRVAAACMLLLAVGWTKALLSRFGNHPSHEPTVVTGPESATWIARALDTPAGAAYAPLRDRLEVRQATVRPDYIMRYRAGERLAYWNPLFSQPRRYPYSILQPIQETYYVLPGGLAATPGRKQVFVGVAVTRPAFASSFEVIAVGDDATALHPDEATAHVHASELLR